MALTADWHGFRQPLRFQLLFPGPWVKDAKDGTDLPLRLSTHWLGLFKLFPSSLYAIRMHLPSILSKPVVPFSLGGLNITLK